MPVPSPQLTLVEDILYSPDGAIVNGWLYITNNQTMIGPDGSEVPEGTTLKIAVVNGQFGVGLVPNVGSTPTGTYYAVKYQVTSQWYTEFWIVPQSPNPSKLTDVRTLKEPTPGIMVPIDQVLPPSVIEGGDYLSWDGTQWVLNAGTSGSTNFQNLTTGTNSQATMTVKSGASIVPDPAHPGVIDANEIQGVAVSSNAPTAGNLLIYDPLQTKWVPGDPLVQGLFAEGHTATGVNPVLVGGKGADGNLHDFSTDNSGVLNVNVLSGGGSPNVTIVGPLDSGNVRVSVENVPAVTVSGTVNIGTMPSVAISNFPASQVVSQSTATNLKAQVVFASPQHVIVDSGGGFATVGINSPLDTHGYVQVAVQNFPATQNVAVVGTAATKDAADGTVGVAAGTTAIQVAGKDDGNNLRPISTTDCGVVYVQPVEPFLPGLVPDRISTGNISYQQSIAISAQGSGTVLFNVLGTWSGTLVFEMSQDGANWYPIIGYPFTGGAGATSLTSGASQISRWWFNVAGVGNLRIRGANVNSGTAEIGLEASSASAVAQVTQADGANLHVNVDNLADITNVTVAQPVAANLNATVVFPSAQPVNVENLPVLPTFEDDDPVGIDPTGYLVMGIDSEDAKVRAVQIAPAHSVADAGNVSLITQISPNQPSALFATGAPSTPPGYAVLTGMVFHSTPPSPTNGQVLPLQSDNAGNLKVAIAGTISIGSVGINSPLDGSGNVKVAVENIPHVIVDSGGGGGVQYAEGTTVATATGTVALAKDSSNVVHGLAVDGSGNLKTAVENTVTVSGSVSVSNFPADQVVHFTSAQHVIVDSATLGTVTVAGTVAATQSGSWTVAANQGTPNTLANAWSVILTDGTNTPTIEQVGTAPVDADYGMTVASILYGHTTAGGGSYVQVKVNPSGTLTVDASGSTVSVSGSVAATQSGTWNIGTVTAVTAITNALPAGTNVIGHVITDSGSTTAVTGTVTVSGTVTVNQGTSPWITNIEASGTALTATGSSLNVNVTGGVSGNASIGVIGSATPASATTIGGTDGTDLRALLTDASGQLKVLVENTVTVSGTVTSNIGTTGGLALDATLTGGTAKTQVYDGTNTIFTSSHPGYVQFGSAQHVIVDSATLGTVTVSGTVTSNQGTSPWIVAGGLTHNSAAPIGNLVGVMPAVASTSTPVYTDGDQVLLSTDLNGQLRVNATFSGTITSSNNIEQWNSVNLGSPTTWGTAPTGATVIGVNANVLNALPAGTNVIGHVIADSGSTTAVTGNVTVVQPTGTNLHAVIDSATLGTVTVQETPAATTGNAPAQVAIGITSTTVLSSNASRKGVNLVNMSSTTISLAFGANAAVSYFGTVLGPGGSFWMDSYDFTTAAINAIADGSNAFLAVQEYQ